MVENNWSFSDTREWEKVSRWNCTGVEQSPINILTDTVTQCKSLCDAEFKYAPTKCKVNYKNGLLRFFVDKGSYLVFKGVVYGLPSGLVYGFVSLGENNLNFSKDFTLKFDNNRNLLGRE